MKKFKKILHSEFSVLNSKAGFTLVEVLITLFILGVVGVILADLLARSFKSNNDIQLTSKLKQSGQIALNNMDQTIRNSDSLVCVGNYSNPPVVNKVIVVKKDSLFTRFIMVVPTTLANGFITKDSPTVVDPSDANLLNQICNPPAPVGFLLTNNDPQSGVSLTEGSFILQGSNAVTIQFKLGPAVNYGFTNNGASSIVDFQTTVQLR